MDKRYVTISFITNKNEHERYVCDGCLSYFTTEAKLHLQNTKRLAFLLAKMPTTELKLNKYGHLVCKNIL